MIAPSLISMFPNARCRRAATIDLPTMCERSVPTTKFIGTPTAEPLDPSTVQLTIPQKFQGNVVALLTEIEQLQVEPDLSARVVIDDPVCKQRTEVRLVIPLRSA